jgi:uncharacterized membrane protein YedE/YeeE
MYTFTSLLSGFVFGFGLIVAGMVDPAKILAFLDLAGKWDPSLALVMVGAIAVGIAAFFIAGRRARSYLGALMQIPTVQNVDRRTLLGNVAFGLGWGMAGFCPGPALVALGSGQGKAAVFVVAMLAGMALFERIERARAKPGAGSTVTAPKPAPETQSTGV